MRLKYAGRGRAGEGGCAAKPGAARFMGPMGHLFILAPLASAAARAGPGACVAGLPSGKCCELV